MIQRKPVRATSPAMRRVLFVFELHGPLDGREVEALAHVSFNYFQNQCRHVLEKAQAIHLVGYRHNKTGPFVPVYAPGPAMGPAPAKPEPLDQLARARKWKERTGYYAAEKAKRRLANPRRIDPALAALMGIERKAA